MPIPISRLAGISLLFATTSYIPALQAQTTVRAQEPTLLEPITLYADRQGKSVLDVPAHISVIQGEEMERQGITDMQELARRFPGVTATRTTSSTDPFSSVAGFQIRGVGGNRVQMLTDGSRVPEGIMDGTRDYLDFAFTKQVDVVRGPASVLWGSDALGGIVAVEIIDPEDLLLGRDVGGKLLTSYDSFDNAARISGAFAQRFGDSVSAFFGISREQAHEPELSNARDDGGIWGCPRRVDYGATTCGQISPTDRDTTHMLGKVIWTPTDAQRLSFSLDHLERDTDVDFRTTLGPNATGTEVVTDWQRQLRTKRTRYAVEHDWEAGVGFIDQLKTTLAFTPGGYQRDGVKSSVISGVPTITRDRLNFDEDFLELDIQATSRFQTGRAQHVVTWGFDGDYTKTDYSRSDRVLDLSTGEETVRNGAGFNFANATTTRADIYVQDEISVGKLEITPGLRYATYTLAPRVDADYSAVPGSEPARKSNDVLLGSLGAIYHLNDTYSVWAHYGQGFKMPTAQQLYTSLPGTSFDLIPAPNLEPEEAESIEIGMRSDYDTGFFSVTGFRADYTNFIESFWNPPGTNDYTYRNLSEVEVWGVELEGGWQVNDALSLTGSAAWQRGAQRAEAGAERTDHTLPPLTAVLAATYDMADYGLSFEAVGTFAAAVTRTSSDTKYKPAGYGLLDLFVSYDIADSAVLNVGIRNAFDKRYFDANAANYGISASDSVAASNPIELQTGPGRTLTMSLDMRF